jgi:NAD(P)-dependent dehydrogenase (short-subunit alcohol dehydrogenase family)
VSAAFAPWLVTGGARGIGRAVVRGAAARGAAVAFSWARDEAAAEALAGGIRGAGGRVLARRAEAGDAGETAALFDAAEAAHGPLGTVVVNAGQVDRATTLAEAEPARLARMVEVNLLGALLTAREAARRLSTVRGGRGGAIVLVSSTAARLGAPFEYVDYAATKGAVDTLTLGLSKELAGEGVRVNAVRPGIIETGIHALSGDPDRAARVGARMPMGRPGTAEEVAETILWLASPAASYVTGALLDVGGGR